MNYSAFGTVGIDVKFFMCQNLALAKQIILHVQTSIVEVGY